MGARWVLGRHRPGSTDGTRRHVVCHQPVRNARGLDWRARVGRDSTKRSGLLIRGFGVRVPGGAPVLTWAFFRWEEAPNVFLGLWETKGRPSVPVASPCRAVRGTMAAVRSAASRARRGETLV